MAEQEATNAAIAAVQAEAPNAPVTISGRLWRDRVCRREMGL